MHGIQSFLLCLAHRKDISGWLRKSSYRSRNTRPEGVKAEQTVLLRDVSSGTAGEILLMAGESGERSRPRKAMLERLALRNKVMRTSSQG